VTIQSRIRTGRRRGSGCSVRPSLPCWLAATCVRCGLCCCYYSSSSGGGPRRCGHTPAATHRRVYVHTCLREVLLVVLAAGGWLREADVPASGPCYAALEVLASILAWPILLGFWSFSRRTGLLAGIGTGGTAGGTGYSCVHSRESTSTAAAADTAAGCGVV
jgi:hypothetical protein